MKWLERNDPELQKAWSAFPDPVMEHNGENWQYVGTVPSDDGWLHCFRHRCHPATDTSMSTQIAASAGWAPSA